MIVTISCVGRIAQERRRVSKAETPRSLAPAPQRFKGRRPAKDASPRYHGFCFLRSAFSGDVGALRIDVNGVKGLAGSHEQLSAWKSLPRKV